MSEETARIDVRRYGKQLTAFHFAAVVAVVGLLAAPLGLSAFQVFTFSGVFFLAVFTATWDFFTGLSGYFNFGHMFLVGAAGYTSALLNAEVGVSLPLSILVATVVTTVFGTVVIAGPSVRLGGIYFAAITFIVPIYAEDIVILFSDVTGGLGGYIFVEPLDDYVVSLIPLGVTSEVLLYYFALFNLLAIVGVLVLFSKSDLGIVLRTIRQEEVLVSSLGINPTKFKLAGFAVTALFTGLTGALWTHFFVTLTPTLQLSVGVMIDIVVAATIGGIGTIVGPVLGMFLLEMIELVLTMLQSTSLVRETLEIELAEYSRFITLVIAVLFLYFYPRGIYPPLRNTLRSVGSDAARGEE